MILADTSLWIDFIDRGSAQMRMFLEHGEILMHPLVLGEFAMGTPRNRSRILANLAALPRAVVAQHDEVMTFIETHNIFGLGIGFIDAHLLTSVKLTPNALLWTRDVRLHRVSEQLGLSFRAA